MTITVACEAKKIFFHHYSAINLIDSKTPLSWLSYGLWVINHAKMAKNSPKNLGMHLKMALFVYADNSSSWHHWHFANDLTRHQQNNSISVASHQWKITQSMNK
ncbi:hypothetical protein T10_10343 [Trichinella papuae]|uniref:Uncharacterized protein n=1 Tax=Trichinella papuae TaxID=268474 RepID=A0A0V1M602_9BILA|nr:hypothetical protein T10_10343 [Trichinella papuae]